MLLLASLASATVLRHALIVGANVGGAGLEPLRYAEDDAERFSELLVELGEFDPVYITVLYGPDELTLREAIKNHAGVASGFDDDLFVFYYSGHADARGLRLGPETYPFEDLRADIRSMDAEVKLGVLDACRSGSITRLKGAALSEPFLYDSRLAAEGEAWITAANADEDAQESDHLRGSFFTHYLVSGLRGAADTNDGQVSLQEAYQYAYDRVVAHTGETAAGAQHPSFDYRISGQGSLALTTMAGGRATVSLPEELAGEVTVLRRPDGTPVAEVAKQAGVPMTLALVPGTYVLRTFVGKELHEAEVRLEDGSRVMAPAFEPRARNTEPSKGATDAAPAPPVFSRDLGEQARRLAEANQGWWTTALNADDLRHSPLLGGTISALVPGGGQFYNRQWVKGGLMMAGTFALFGGSVFVPDTSFFTGSITGPDPLALGAFMLYGAAVADAAHYANPNAGGMRRPRGGGTLSTYAGWNPANDFSTPYIAGVSADWLLHPNLAIGVDRLGWTRSDETESRWSFGSKVTFAIENERWRGGLFLAGGGRVVQDGEPVVERTRTSTEWEWEDPGSSAMEAKPESADASSRLVGVVGLGVQGRYYVTPRYFIESEARFEVEDAEPLFLVGGGVGLHFGN